MKKLGIILDSFSSLTKKEVNKLGYDYLSMQVILDGKMYREGLDFSDYKNSIDKIVAAKDKKTSQPNPGDIEDLFKEVSKKYEKVIYLCIGSKLSSSFSTATALSTEYNGQIEVFDNSLSGPGFVKVAKYFDEQVNKNGANVEDVKKEVRAWEKEIQTWIIPETIDAIQKGGRVKKGAKFLLSKLSIIPMIYYRNASIEIKGVRRGFSKAVSTAIGRVLDVVGDKKNDFEFAIMHTNKKSALDLLEGKLKDAGITKYSSTVACTANVIQCGVGAISIMAMPKKIKE